MGDLKVKKKDGSTEEWSFDKLAASIGKSGIEVEKATEIARNVGVWATENAKEGVIESSMIRDKVFNEMQSVDSVAAEAYRVYKKA